jgi:alanyl-tRNA synthetase
VRVVSMGAPEGNAVAWSVELCGGTHVDRTGDIGIISIIGEGGVSSGVRRIEALTGYEARKRANAMIKLVNEVAHTLHGTVAEAPARAATLIEERKKLERDLSDARKKLAMGGGAMTAAQVAADGSNRGMDGVGPLRGLREMGDIKLFTRTVSGVDLKDLRSIADEAKKLVGSGVVAIVGRSDDGKAGVVVGVTKDLTARFDAVELVRKGAEVLGGKGGGGRPDMAQAGGPDGSKADAALDAIEKAIVGG